MGWLRPGSNALLPVFGFSMGELDLMKKGVYPAISFTQSLSSDGLYKGNSCFGVFFGNWECWTHSKA